jgi:hypothetical protein
MCGRWTPTAKYCRLGDGFVDAELPPLDPECIETEGLPYRPR